MTREVTGLDVMSDTQGKSHLSRIIEEMEVEMEEDTLARQDGAWVVPTYTSIFLSCEKQRTLKELSVSMYVYCNHFYHVLQKQFRFRRTIS